MANVPTSVEATGDSSPPAVRFTSTKNLFSVINSITTRDFLTVTNVSPSDFAKIERERDKRRRKFRFRRYDSSSQILFITLPTLLHEVLHLDLYARYRDQLVRSGTERSWRSIGSTTYRVAHGHHGGDVGEGDSTGGPRSEHHSKGAWPTLVVEAGHSQSLGELHNDMRWWFSASNHQVKIVLLAKFDHARSIIILERWEKEPQTRQGATTTRRFASLQQTAALQPRLQQNITISQNAATNPVSYNVTRGALKLPFRLLFLRDPGPGEADFVLSVEELELYAAMVWESV